MTDLRHALRALLGAPGFTSVSVITLALAIGACTAIYSVVYGVLLQPLPYPDPDRLVQVWQINQSGRHNQFSDPNFEDVRDNMRMLGPVAQYAQGNNMILAGDQPRRVAYTSVSREFLDVFRTGPRLGRAFNDAERVEGGPAAAIISHRLWIDAFGGREDLAALRLRVSGQPYAVVGVMPPQFDFPLGTDVWVARERTSRNPYRTGHNWRVVARLSDGAALNGARAEISSFAKRQKAALGDQTQMFDAALVPLAEELTGPVSRRLIVLLAAVASLVLIACANLVNLLLVRVASRGRELAVRAALGAGRGSLVAPFVFEAMLLALAGGALGILVASAGLSALLALDPGNLPRASEVRLSGPVLFFALGVTFVTALVLALAAAWRALRPEIADSLRSASRGQAGGAAVSRLRSALIVAQLASSIVLLIGAGLLARSMMALLSQDPGFRTERVLTVEISSTGSTRTPEALAARTSLYERLLDGLRSLPGVDAVGGINSFPLGGGYANGGFLKVRGDEDWSKGFDYFRILARDPSRTGDAEFRVATRDYFTVMGIPLKRGRLFEPGDVPDAPHVAVVSESLARTAWPNDDAIGKRVQFGNMDGDLRVFTVVGVVGDIKERGLDTGVRPTLYADHRQRPLHAYTFTAVVSGAIDPSTLTASAREVVRRLNPEMAPRIRDVEEIYASSVADRRFTLIVVGAFSAAALLLAVLGVYGVLSYVVSQRTREFGVRLALGAQRGDVWRLVLRQAAVLVAAGSVIGLSAAFALTRLMRTLLYEITPLDPITFGGVVLVLAAAAFAASQVPALRATRVSPMEALRSE